MKDKIAIVLLGLLFNASLMAQGFMKSYDIENTGSNNGGDILTDNSGVTILSASECYNGLECTGLIKTDFNGFEEWSNLFENPNGNFSPADGMQNLADGGYIITGGLGHLENYGTIFFLRISEQGDSLHLKEYGNIEQREGTIHMAIKDDTLYSAIFYGAINGTYANLKLLKMDTCFEDLTEILLSGVSGNEVNYASALTLSPDSTFLYFNIRHKTTLSSSFHLLTRKIDLQGNTIWDYPLSGYTTFTNTPTQVVVLPNGNIVTRWFDEIHYAGSNVFDSNPYLICLNSEGDSVWRYNFNADVYRKSPIEIKLAANGDIIGCGYTDNPNYNYSCGWLFRISPQGQLLWEREYISYTPIVNFLLLEGIDEDPDGNIVATGLIIDALPNGGVEGNALLLKVLPNGCFTPNCNVGAEDTLIVASTVTGVAPHLLLPPKEGNGRLMVFPNPANNQLQVLLPNSPNRQSATLQLIDLQGRVLKSATLPTTTNSPFVNLSTNELPNGMYVLTYTVLGVVQARAKVVVNHATN